MAFACKRGDVPIGKGRLVTVDGKEVALFNVDGQFYAIRNECAHLGGPLAEGLLRGCRVTCPWHDWEYDVTTGKETLSGEESVPSYPVTIEGDDVMIEVG